MTLDELEQLFRDLTDDAADADPQLWTTTQITGYAERAENEACSRKPLLTSSTIESLCHIDVSEGESLYPRDPKVLSIFSAKFVTETETYNLFITDIEELTLIDPDFELLEGYPKYLLVTDDTVELVPTPEDDGTIKMQISHLPEESISEKDPQVPTISTTHHYNLIYWMLYLGYSKKDADTHSPKLAAENAAIFATYFGEPKGANQLKSVRIVRENRRSGSWI